MTLCNRRLFWLIIVTVECLALAYVIPRYTRTQQRPQHPQRRDRYQAPVASVWTTVAPLTLRKRASTRPIRRQKALRVQPETITLPDNYVSEAPTINVASCLCIQLVTSIPEMTK